MEEQQKKLIDEKTIKGIRVSNNVAFIIVVSITGFLAILSLILAPLPANILFFLILAGMEAFWIIYKIKKGVKGVYFKKMPVTEKQIGKVRGEDGDDITAYYLFFGEHNISIPEYTYNEKREGDMFYVLFDARNERILKIYDVNEYELSPTLDIRNY